MKLRLAPQKRRYIVIVTLFALISPNGIVFAQESYRTYHGTIVITTEINNEPVKYVSNELDVQLNYETAEFIFILNKNTILTDNIAHLNLFKPDIVQFHGKLGIEFIKTDSHPLQIFGVEGILSTNAGLDLAINATGSLNHLYSNTSIACWLNIKMQLDRHEIKGFVLDSATTSDMSIEITNTVLDEN